MRKWVPIPMKIEAIRLMRTSLVFSRVNFVEVTS